MRSKTPLMLAELLIMLLVFTVAAGLCLRIFLHADRISRDNAQRDMAIAAAQNGAELAKFYAGDFSSGAADHGGTWNGNCWTFTNGACDVTITLLPADQPYLGSAHIHAQAGNQGPAVEFTVTWQKGHTHE